MLVTNSNSFTDQPVPARLTRGQRGLDPCAALTESEIDRVIEMAWEDRTPVEAIEFQFGLRESDVKMLMKKHLKIGSYKLWRTRVENCSTKHRMKQIKGTNRFKSNLQRAITNNKISKR